MWRAIQHPASRTEGPARRHPRRPKSAPPRPRTCAARSRITAPTAGNTATQPSQRATSSPPTANIAADVMKSTMTRTDAPASTRARRTSTICTVVINDSPSTARW